MKPISKSQQIRDYLADNPMALPLEISERLRINYNLCNTVSYQWRHSYTGQSADTFKATNHQVTIKVSPETAATITAIAVKEKKSDSAVCRDLIETALKKKGK